MTLNRYEISPEGFTEDMIADLPPDSVYLFEAGSGPCRWLSYDINGHCRGATTVVLRYGKGSIVLLGFDLSRTGSILVRSGWRKRILDILSIAGIEMAVYWSGPAAVQCLYYGDRVALANYNFADITGELAASGGPPRQVTLGGHEVRVIKLLTAR